MFFYQLLERTFGKSSKSTNIAISLSFASFLLTIALLPVYRATGSVWASYAGAACFVLAIAFCAIALSAQTVTQIVILLSGRMAKIFGFEPHVFKEDVPQYAKIIKKAYRITKATGANLFKSIKTPALSRVYRVIARIRTNARSYRRPPRPVFAHASPRGGGGGGSGDDSGDSDQGDPPGPSYHTFVPLTLKLSKTFYRKSNSPSCRRRPSRAFGCWRVPSKRRYRGRWFA
jgi:hypothetical protein